MRNIGVNSNGVLIEYSNIEGVRDTLSILIDSISAHNLRLINLEGKTYLLFNDIIGIRDTLNFHSDSLSVIYNSVDTLTTSLYDSLFNHLGLIQYLESKVETDPIYSQDSIKIVWFKDLKPIQDSLKTGFDTLGIHNTRLLALEIDTAYWNNKVSQEELADSTLLLRGLITNSTI
jgi:hypothetical protein